MKKKLVYSTPILNGTGGGKRFVSATCVNGTLASGALDGYVNDCRAGNGTSYCRSGASASLGQGSICVLGIKMNKRMVAFPMGTVIRKALSDVVIYLRTAIQRVLDLI